MKLRKNLFLRSCNFTLKNRFFQHRYQKQVKMYLFHDWFPIKFVFTYNISLCSNIKYLELIKRRSNVQKNNMSCERTLNFDQ